MEQSKLGPSNLPPVEVLREWELGRVSELEKVLAGEATAFQSFDDNGIPLEYFILEAGATLENAIEEASDRQNRRSERNVPLLGNLTVVVMSEEWIYSTLESYKASLAFIALNDDYK